MHVVACMLLICVHDVVGLYACCCIHFANLYACCCMHVVINLYNVFMHVVVRMLCPTKEQVGEQHFNTSVPRSATLGSRNLT